MSKIEIKNLFLVFGHEKQKALRLLSEGVGKDEILKKTGCTVAVNNANLQIAEGEIFVIMGLSGSGKSTLLRCINRLIKPTSGQVSLMVKIYRRSPTKTCATFVARYCRWCFRISVYSPTGRYCKHSFRTRIARRTTYRARRRCTGRYGTGRTRWL